MGDFSHLVLEALVRPGVPGEERVFEEAVDANFRMTAGEKDSLDGALSGLGSRHNYQGSVLLT